MIRLKHPLRLAGAAVILLVPAFAFTSFAAANTVPRSAVEDVSQTVTITPVVPLDCRSFNFAGTIYGSGIIVGTNGFDLIYGSASADTITGLNGSDCIVGAGANDIIDGGNAGDVLYGGDGNDILTGGNGPDVCYGGAGVDVFVSCETAVQ